MNPFINPLFTIPFLKHYLFDSGRLHRSKHEQIIKSRNKLLKKILDYTYTVPVYKEKYEKNGINIKDIKSTDDIPKLPFVSKKDFIDNFPKKIVPENYDFKKGFVVTTGGSSGKPVSVYTDFHTLSRGLCLAARQNRVYNYNLRKIRFASVGNHLPGRIDNIFENTVISQTKVFRKKGNYIAINAFEPMKDIINKLNEFKPDVIYTYPITLLHIAYFKRKGYCDNINPKILQVSGYSLDQYTKKYVEDAFNCKVVNLYQSVEGGGDIAFECLEGTWHVNYDMFYIETVDEKWDVVSGERGHIVLTRLFGRGTPFVRYTGLDDWVTIVDDYKCNCGLRTPILKNGVEGRVSARIILPDGRIFPAESFAIISLILKDLNTFKIRQFQIIQKKIDEIEILVVVDNDLRDVEPSLDFIYKKIKDAYQEKCGPGVKINIKEVDEIKSPPGKPLPYVISNVKIEDGFKILEW